MRSASEQRPLRLLVFSTVFPNAAQPHHGVFVRERMCGLPADVEARVVAPTAWFPFVSGLLRRLRPGLRPRLPREETQDGVRVLHPRFLCVPGIAKCLDGLLLFLSVLPAVARLRRDWRFDAIDAHFAYPEGLAAVLLGRLFRVPVLITLRGTEPLVARFRLRRPQLCFALRHADRVVAVAPSLAADAVALGLPAGRVRVIDNGVDPERFRPLDRAACRRALGLPAGDPLLVAVGMLAPRKGFHLVIEALPRLVPRFPGLRFAIVGGPGAEGAMEAELRALALQLGVADRVVFAGVQPRGELPVWYSAADVSVLASGHEGCPNVVLESLACGTPVVATPVGSIPEILSGFARGARQADPQAGLLAERTVPALAAALGDALARSWDREAVRARVAARSWQAVGREVMEEIEAALTPRPPLPSPALVRRLS